MSLDTLSPPTIIADGAEYMASSVRLGENMEAYSRVTIKINSYYYVSHSKTRDATW
jgi:hypothetical protein